ncbi:hypothetical protein [Escherichia coli]|uniref:hypothetical protein n=1 Tax=Escherichia coli TaxID=562 RepID=UPI001E3DECFA|nr:hypothetical protein [Escherichia coli]
MKRMKLVLTISLLFSCSAAFADLQCGGYLLHVADNGWTKINGEQVTSQKITFLGKKDDWDNVKTNMGLMPSRDGNNYGFEFVKHNGKAFLNVQLLQNSMDAPKIIGSFPCKKVAG